MIFFDSLTKGITMKLQTLAAISLALGLAACSHGPKSTEDTTSISPATAAAARSVDAAYVSEVSFGETTTTLTPAAKAELKTLVDQAKATGRIDEIKVAAWADKEYPAAEVKKLTSKDRELAKKRANAVKDYLEKDLNVSDVEVFNMADRPSALERWMNTSDAKVKNALESSGIGTTANKSMLSSKASQAVVMVVLK